MNKQPLLTLSLTRHFLKKTPSHSLTYLNCPKHDNMVRTLSKNANHHNNTIFRWQHVKNSWIFPFSCIPEVWLRSYFKNQCEGFIRVSKHSKKWKYLTCSLMLSSVFLCLETLMKPSHSFFKIVHQEWMISTSYHKPK